MKLLTLLQGMEVMKTIGTSVNSDAQSAFSLNEHSSAYKREL